MKWVRQAGKNRLKFNFLIHLIQFTERMQNKQDFPFVPENPVSI